MTAPTHREGELSGIEKAAASAIDEAAIAAYANDLRDMTPAQIENEIRQAEREIEEVEPWLEALVAWQRRLPITSPEGSST